MTSGAICSKLAILEIKFYWNTAASFIYIFSMGVFRLWWQSQVAVKQTVWLAKAKLFSIQPFINKQINKEKKSLSTFALEDEKAFIHQLSSPVVNVLFNGVINSPCLLGCSQVINRFPHFGIRGSLNARSERSITWPKISHYHIKARMILSESVWNCYRMVGLREWVREYEV